MSRTADVLGVERSNLYRKMKAFGIAPARRRGRGEVRSVPSSSGFSNFFELVLEHLIGREA